MSQLATEKQVSYIKALGAQRVSPTGTWQWESDVDYFATLDKSKASYVISRMQGLPKKQAETLPVDAHVQGAPVEGVHTVKTSKGVAIVKVQTAIYGSGRLYTKVFSPSAKKFVRQTGWLFKVSESTLMSKDEAAKFGALYGVCMRCARPLTDEDSIAAGLGSHCRSEMGF